MIFYIEIPLIGKKVKYPFRWLMGLIASGVLIVGTTATIQTIQQKNKPLDVTKLTVPVEAKSVTVRITASGKVQPVQSVNISPKSPGLLADLNVEQGDTVKQGQIIARMDNSEIKMRILQYQANLAQAKAQLAESEAGSRPEEIAQAKARVDQAQAQLAIIRDGNRLQEIQQAQAQVDSAKASVALTQSRVKRYQDLAKDGAISQDSLEQYVSENSKAKANLEEAQRRLSLLKVGNRNQDIQKQAAIVNQEKEGLRKLENGNRPQEIARLKAAVASAEAQLKQQQVQLEDTIIRAPFSGIVTQRYATVGGYVSPAISASSNASATSTSIVALAKGLEVLANVPEVDISQIKQQQKVEITIDAYPEEVFQGQVRLIAPEAVVDQNVTSFQVRVAINTGAEKLRSGMNVSEVTFLGNNIKDALLIPQELIVTRKGKTGVWLLGEKNKPQFRLVTIGANIDNQIQVLDGLKAGDRVFIDLPKTKEKEKIEQGKENKK
ncbi:MAG: efflux RND transporter periplasmic adaptor subunit [Nostocales cyanobacterium LE14-WE4]|jgi:HlyD family secretion protein|uniref:efflux RND transporter periplasmic adaptor subunit n=1 Tax=Anabaena sp. AL09 TaxID=1710891 RepID=UPI00080078AF|nr:efflux RND transporter periplasmic adaptor subunit [Anabaena sp. AL09]MBJ7295906.1 efflux RND transporter periplasmic adaptor subunit [Dolichospermum sp.]MCE2698280.1 efflux RND transporter periplasmic adaptor subunit [Anabaena sp. 49633_E8]MDJ0500670.1 efflux RND transporter periplasmic adaptor subunit [Nostocales cyanobacterium LE14-WE4]MCE2701375.1 efflux RND transporter periplasmic adaptor subunit [Anabaena sp. 49633_E8]OBQ10995.1 MAG: RND transporter [Anabaena sp. AL09]